MPEALSSGPDTHGPEFPPQPTPPRNGLKETNRRPEKSCLVPFLDLAARARWQISRLLLHPGYPIPLRLQASPFPVDADRVFACSTNTVHRKPRRAPPHFHSSSPETNSACLVCSKDF